MACSSSSSFRHRYFRRMRSPHRKAKPTRERRPRYWSRHLWPFGCTPALRTGWPLCWRLWVSRTSVLTTYYVPGPGRPAAYTGCGDAEGRRALKRSSSSRRLSPQRPPQLSRLQPLPAPFRAFHLLPCEPEHGVSYIYTCRPFVFRDAAADNDVCARWRG